VTSLIVATSALTSTEHVHTSLKGIHLLHNGCRGSGGGRGSSTGGSRSGSGEGARVGKEGLELGSLLEGVVVKSEGDGNAGIEGLADGVGDRGLVGKTDLERDGSDSGEGKAELADDDIGGDVEDGGGEGGAVIVHKADTKTVRKGLDVQLVEEGGLGVTDLVASLHEVDGVGDLDLTLGNLGGDLEDLEEVGLSWVATSGAGRDVHVIGGNGTHTGRGGHAVSKNHVSHVSQAAVGEHESDVSLEVGKESLDRVLGVLLQSVVDNLADKSVLSHKNLGGTSHHDTSGVELLRTDIVHLHNKDLGVGGNEAVKLLKVQFLLFLRQRHNLVGV
jgi:hypothetical protein